jgi:hypothetical protein
MTEDTKFPELALFGGPLQRLGVRLGLARGETGSFRLGLALGLPAWGGLVLLAFLKGLGPPMFSLPAILAHVRILLVIPLFFACESFAGPVIAEFARNLRDSRMVHEDQWPDLASIIRRVRRLSGGWPAGVLFFLVAFGEPWVAPLIGLPVGMVNWTSILTRAGHDVTAVNAWYLKICLPLFRFLIMRWLWRLGLWWYFLWRLKKLKLYLAPTHSDGAGGLGFLAVVQEHFLPLALAISAAFSAAFAEGILLGTLTFESLYSLIPGVLILVAGLFIGPLLLFSRKLWDCRVTGLDEYMAMATRYVLAFDRKWVRDPNATGESQLGTGDLQSLADLTNSLNVVRGIQMVPGGMRLLLWMAGCVLVPMMPLVLLKYPIDQVARVLIRALAGV